MKLIGPFVGLLLFGISSCQLRIPKRELGFVYNGGNASAPVKIDAFLDLLCPDSKRAYGVIRQVVDHYGPKVIQLRVHIFPLPYHRNAFMAGKGAFAVDKLTGGSRTFDWIHDVFDQMSMFSNGFTHRETGARVLSDLSTLAHALGVQTNDFENLMTANEDLELDARLAWKYGCSRAIHSTPMVMINDVLVNVQNPETLTYEQWMSIISDLLKFESGPDNPITNSISINLRDMMTCVNQVSEPDHPIELVASYDKHWLLKTNSNPDLHGYFGAYQLTFLQYPHLIPTPEDPPPEFG